MDQHSQTSASMLQGMRNRDPQQWERFVEVYSPLAYEWCRRAGVGSSDSADVVQAVFMAVALSIEDFRTDESFHRWLWGITRHKTLDHFRKLVKQPTAAGGSTAKTMLAQVPDGLPEYWDEASQRSDTNMVYNRALELLKTDFQPKTWQAFWKTTVEALEAADVADNLSMTVGAVYNARYKVLRRLRDEFQGMFETEVV